MAKCKQELVHEEDLVPLSMVTGAVLAGSRTVLGPGSVLGGWTGSGKPGDWLKKSIRQVALSRHVINTSTFIEQGQQQAKSTMSLGTFQKCRHTVSHLFMLLIQYFNSRLLVFRIQE